MDIRTYSTAVGHEKELIAGLNDIIKEPPLGAVYQEPQLQSVAALRKWTLDRARSLFKQPTYPEDKQYAIYWDSSEVCIRRRREAMTKLSSTLRGEFADEYEHIDYEQAFIALCSFEWPGDANRLFDDFYLYETAVLAYLDTVLLDNKQFGLVENLVLTGCDANLSNKSHFNSMYPHILINAAIDIFQHRDGIEAEKSLLNRTAAFRTHNVMQEDEAMLTEQTPTLLDLYGGFESIGDMTPRQRFNCLMSLLPDGYRETLINQYKAIALKIMRVTLRYCEIYRAHTAKQAKKYKRQLEDWYGRWNTTAVAGSYSSGQQSRQMVDEYNALLTEIAGWSDDSVKYSSFATVIQFMTEMEDIVSENSVPGENSPFKQCAEDIRSIVEGLDPYEFSLAFLLMVEDGDDFVWLFGVNNLMLKIIGRLCPWFISPNDKSPMLSKSALELWLGARYEPNRKQPPYNTSILQATGEDPREVSCNSIGKRVYGITGCVPSRWRNPLLYQHVEQLLSDCECDDRVKAIVQILADTASLSHIKDKMQIHVGTILAQTDMAEDDEVIDDTEPNIDNAVSSPQNTLSTDGTDDPAVLKREIKSLKAQLHDSDKSITDMRKQQEKSRIEQDREHQELLELRELLYQTLEHDGKEENTDDSTEVIFPCAVQKRVVVYGGHDSWEREIKLKLPDVKFMGRLDSTSTDSIRKADAVWVQTNCMSHALYNKVCDAAKMFGVPVHYFRYASAEKCARQVVNDDMT